MGLAGRLSWFVSQASMPIWPMVWSSAVVGPKAAWSRKRAWERFGMAGGASLMVRNALPRAVGAATLVAVTVMLAGLGMAAGAVKSPVGLMVPAVADQVTAVLALPTTVAESCCVPLKKSWAAAGETVTVTAGWLSVTTAETATSGSATLVAVTSAVGGFGRMAGAV